MITLSGSCVDRAYHCPASCALPAVHSDSEDAAAGRGVGDWLDAVAEGRDPVAALAGMTPEHAAICRAIDPALVPRGVTQVAYAYDVVTGRARRIDTKTRAYDVRAGEIPGTLDLLERRPGGRWRVVDWKLALGSFDLAYHRPQISFYGLCVARAARVDQVDCAIGIVADTGALSWEEWTLDWAGLASVAAHARKAHARVAHARAERAAHEVVALAPWVPDVNEGPWCQFCKTFAYCPGKRAAVSALLGRELDGAFLDPTAAGAAYIRVRDAEKLAEGARKTIKLLLAQSGGPAALPTDDGRVVRLNSVGALSVTRERVSGARAANGR